jgi:hypothetical protein
MKLNTTKAAAHEVAAITTLAILEFGVLAGGSSTRHEDWSFKNSRIADQLMVFCSEKEAQADAATRAEGKELSPEFKAFFAAAAEGDWLGVSNAFQCFHKRAPQYIDGGTDMRLRGTAWEAIKEVWGADEIFAVGGEEFFVPSGREIIGSIPPGSIYFGGTDVGRFLITSLVKSQIKGDPFFVLTQNALADNTYLAYLDSMYGNKIHLPTDDEVKTCSKGYMADALRRLEHDTKFRNEPRQLKPGEDVHAEGSASGMTVIMSVNALLAKDIFDNNPDREFYLEESFPLDWMYPNLEPHGLIMKINRRPLAVMPAESVRKDHEYWRDRVAGFIGNWLMDDTPSQTVADFVGRVYGRGDLSEFHGNRGFVRNHYANKVFSKWRTSIGNVYAWRANSSKSPDEQKRMLKEADFAYRQAWVLCPYSPEAVFQYVNLLLNQQRKSEALLILKTAARVIPPDDINNMKTQLDSLIGKIEG